MELGGAEKGSGLLKAINIFSEVRENPSREALERLQTLQRLEHS